MTELEKYQALENKINNSNETLFVVRDTNHPVEDLVRDWSSYSGGWDNGLVGCGFDTEEEAINEFIEEEGDSDIPEMRFHPAYNGFVCVHYEGLGAFQLDAKNVKDAIKEADFLSKKNELVCCDYEGTGHFESYQVVSFHKVRDGRYIFEIK